MNFNINSNINKLIKIFKQNNYQCYIVGGFIRDSLLNIPSNDYDLCTDATPEQIMELLNENHISYSDKFKAFGSIHLYFDDINTCITTFRKDEQYHDHHQPSDLTFTRDIKADMQRRDFTINALYYDNEQLLDFTNGQQALENKLIQTIGEPNLRFQEDPLRMLRAIRLSCVLDFSIEKHTLEALKNNAHLIKNISNDKIREELLKTINKRHYNLLTLLKNSHLLDFIFPEFISTYNFPQRTKFHKYDVFNHIAKASDYYSGNDYRLTIALFFHDIGKPKAHTCDDQGVDHFKKHSLYSAQITEKILQRYHFSKKDTQYICQLILEHDMRFQIDDYQLKINELVVKHQKDLNFINDLLCIVNCDNHAKSDFVYKYNIQPIVNAKNYFNQLTQSACYRIKDLKITIQDIVNKFDISWEQANNLLNSCLLDVLNQKLDNNKDTLLRRIENEIFNS